MKKVKNLLARAVRGYFTNMAKLYDAETLRYMRFF